MSDGSKFIPDPEPLDDIILGEDDTHAEVLPVVPAKPSSPPPLHRPSARPPDRPSAPPLPTPSAPPPRRSSSSRLRAAADARDSQGRKRAKMTLRIPDDEVARPTSSPSTPVAAYSGESAASHSPPGGMAVTSPSRPPSSPDEIPMPLLRPLSVPPGPPPKRSQDTGPPPPSFVSADDTLELPQDELRARVAALTADPGASFDGRAVAPRSVPPAVGVDASHEPGWTPFQPDVTGDNLPEDHDTIPPAPPIEPTRIVELRDPATPQTVPGTLPDPYEVDAVVAAPISEEIPVEMDIDVAESSSDEVETNPRLTISRDSEEIRIDEAPYDRASEPVLRSTGIDRAGETGEVEVLAEDLVSVESLPSPGLPGGQAYAPGLSPPPLKGGAKTPSFPEPALASAPGPKPITQDPAKAGSATATALMAAAPAAAPSRPAMAAVVEPVSAPREPIPSEPPAPIAMGSAAAPSNREPPATVKGGQAARRQPSSPLVIVPPVGGLAPPPMTDTAAMRKKTRPWWEELFNDDFIRTMAKVTDGQIGKEVNFIEESLGCEAGAMILDLACGTGRHAVELAARGYQVVGFDLSLAMLARASDEAQDRKQKINFVQGDMREMTFEETFDGVYSWNTSFGYFDEEKNGAVIARVHKALKKGGQFLLDVVNRDYIVRQAPSLAWFEGDGCICMDEMMIDFITSRMKVKRTLMMDDGRTKEIEYSVRVYALHELGKMLHDNGFRVAEVSGRTGTPGVFFGCESPRTLILAEKR